MRAKLVISARAAGCHVLGTVERSSMAVLHGMGHSTRFAMVRGAGAAVAGSAQQAPVNTASYGGQRTVKCERVRACRAKCNR